MQLEPRILPYQQSYLHQIPVPALDAVCYISPYTWDMRRLQDPERLRSVACDYMRDCLSNAENQGLLEQQEGYISKQGLKGNAILMAEGGTTRGTWVFEAAGMYCAVQDWLNAVDGKYARLFVFCCNPDNCQPDNSGTSLIYIPLGPAFIRQDMVATLNGLSKTA